MGVHHQDVHTSWCQSYQARSRIHLQRSPNHQDEVSFLHDLGRLTKRRDLLAKPHNVRPELVAVWPHIPE